MATAESHIKNPAEPELPRQLHNESKEERRSHQHLPILPIFGVFFVTFAAFKKQ